MFLAKKWGILIKKKSESLIFTGLEIPRDYFKTKEELLQELPQILQKGDTVLVKASHFMGFEDVVKELEKNKIDW